MTDSLIIAIIKRIVIHIFLKHDSPVSAVISLRAKVDNDPPHQIREWIHAEDEGVGDVGENIDKQMFQRMTVVRGESYWSSPLMMNLVNMLIQSSVMS